MLTGMDNARPIDRQTLARFAPSSATNGGREATPARPNPVAPAPRDTPRREPAPTRRRQSPSHPAAAEPSFRSCSRHDPLWRLVSRVSDCRLADGSATGQHDGARNVKFAFYGRVSTEDQQDPASSRNWQLARARPLIEASGGSLVQSCSQTTSPSCQGSPVLASRLMASPRSDPRFGLNLLSQRRMSLRISPGRVGDGGTATGLTSVGRAPDTVEPSTLTGVHG
jgi:hypothetical protein